MAQQLRWEKTNKDTKSLMRYARPGMTFYGVTELDRRSLAPKHMCDRWTVTRMQFGHPMCGSMSLEQVLHEHGPLYTEPIDSHEGKPLHPMWKRLPQVSGPIGDDNIERFLDEPELRGMDKLKAEAEDRRRKSKSGRKGWF